MRRDLWSASAPDRLTATATAFRFRSPGIEFGLSILLLAVVYQVGYLTYPAVPGNDPVHPLGWWGWADQGLYLQAAKDIASGRFSPEVHFFPPLYSVLGSAFLPIMKDHIFYLLDLAMMLGYALLFLMLMSRYIGSWLSIVALIAGTIALEPIRVQWIIPWTSTPAALFMIGALYLLDRYFRLKGGAGWSLRSSASNAALFGFVVALLIATRPGDFLAALPMVFAYGSSLIKRIATSNGQRPGVAWEIIAGVLGALPPVIAFMAFNLSTFNSITGRYLDHVANNGLFLADLPEKFYSQILDSSSFYGERGADWLSVLPVPALCLAVLVPAVFWGPAIFRVAALSVLVSLSAAFAYSDIVPTGTFRFFNIHYFKWVIPIIFAMALYFMTGVFAHNDQKRTASRRVLLCSALIVAGALSVVPGLDRRDAPLFVQNQQFGAIQLPPGVVDYIDFQGVEGGWTDIYFARGVSLGLEGRQLRFPRDYHLFQVPGGMRLLFVRPIGGGLLTLDLGDRLRFKPDSVAAESVAVSFGAGSPLHRRKKTPFNTYHVGDVLAFSSGGQAEPYLGSGWSGGEAWGRWIDGDEAYVNMRVTSSAGVHLKLFLKAGGFVAPPRKPRSEARLFANACSLGTVQFTDGGHRNLEFSIPAQCVKDGKLSLRLANIGPKSPRSVGLSSDGRRLGLSVVSLRLEKEKQ